MQLSWLTFAGMVASVLHKRHVLWLRPDSNMGKKELGE